MRGRRITHIIIIDSHTDNAVQIGYHDNLAAAERAYRLMIEEAIKFGDSFVIDLYEVTPLRGTEVDLPENADPYDRPGI